jgi:hypothetical protein
MVSDNNELFSTSKIPIFVSRADVWNKRNALKSNA